MRRAASVRGRQGGIGVAGRERPMHELVRRARERTADVFAHLAHAAHTGGQGAVDPLLKRLRFLFEPPHLAVGDREQATGRDCLRGRSVGGTVEVVRESDQVARLGPAAFPGAADLLEFAFEMDVDVAGVGGTGAEQVLAGSELDRPATVEERLDDARFQFAPERCLRDPVVVLCSTHRVASRGAWEPAVA